MLKPLPSEKRLHMRFNKVFPVVVGSEIYGDSEGVARNISAGGMMIEMVDPLPLGSVITVHFQVPGGPGEMVVRGEVKNHYCFNFAIGDEPTCTRGIGLRFLEFLEDSESQLEQAIAGSRILH